MAKKTSSVDKYNRNNRNICNLMSEGKTAVIVKVYNVKYKSKMPI